eukprot:4366610-Alexandrium_andersonii.AAC.1
MDHAARSAQVSIGRPPRVLVPLRTSVCRAKSVKLALMRARWLMGSCSRPCTRVPTLLSAVSAPLDAVSAPLGAASAPRKAATVPREERRARGPENRDCKDRPCLPVPIPWSMARSQLKPFK